MSACKAIIRAKARPQTALVTFVEPVSSNASAMSSKTATHSMAPAAKPRPTGRKGMNWGGGGWRRWGGGQCIGVGGSVVWPVCRQRGERSSVNELV